MEQYHPASMLSSLRKGPGRPLPRGISIRPMSAQGHSLPVARRRAGREVRSGPKADLIPTPWLMLLASLTEEHDHAVSSERDPRAP